MLVRHLQNVAVVAVAAAALLAPHRATALGQPMLRPAVHNVSPLVPVAPSAPVVVGADRLLREYAHLVRGKRLALVSNHSGRLADGTHLADALFRLPGQPLRVLFGMDQDIRTNDYSAPHEGERAIDATTGLTKYNLYGETHRPTREMFADANVVVFDIQEVGARFYEHINILGFVMDAAAEYGLEVVVLDRPNPITGTRVDGFVTDAAYRFRFGSYAAVPVQHGMTMAELAQFYNGERLLQGGKPVTLHIVPMTGWTRTMWLDDTGLPWRKPSPNLLTPNSLLAYIGTCLFEAVNVSEGRGSDAPFETLGAPWLDNQRAVQMLNALALPGVRFDTITFTPTQRAFHSRPPELAGERLAGIAVRILDRQTFQPYRVGVAALWAVQQLHGDRLVWNDAVLERLTATPRLKTMLRAGRTPAEIYASWEGEVRSFVAAREKYLLYR
ncbi:MAG: DUF1343 domain-containing protein [Gemmatimonadota bacterium]|nr:DUF1343 domain-containing protein [Gemmatimonadota bacterium]